MAEVGKREREETDVELALQELEGAVNRDAELKIKALSKLRELVDPHDESYSAQQDVLGAGGQTVVMQYLEDASDAVAVEAAQLITALGSHSKTAHARLMRATVFETPEKVALNPLQGDLAEEDGLLETLIDMLLSSSQSRSEAAEAALKALCSYNRPNQVSQLRQLLGKLGEAPPSARLLAAIDDLLGGVEVKEDVAVMIDSLAIPPLIRALTAGDAAQQRHAATQLLGTICEKRPAATSFLIDEGALAPVVRLLLEGDGAGKDAAVHTAWLLVKGNRGALHPDSEALGVTGEKLIGPLSEIIEAGRAKEQEEEEEEGGEEEEGVGAEADGEDTGAAGAAAAAAAAGEGAGEVCDSADEAKLLLEALAAADPGIQAKVASRSSYCCIM